MEARWKSFGKKKKKKKNSHAPCELSETNANKGTKNTTCMHAANDPLQLGSPPLQSLRAK